MIKDNLLDCSVSMTLYRMAENESTLFFLTKFKIYDSAIYLEYTQIYENILLWRLVKLYIDILRPQPLQRVNMAALIFDL